MRAEGGRLVAGILRRSEVETRIEAASRARGAVRILGWAGVGKSVLREILSERAEEARLESEPVPRAGTSDVVVPPFCAEETEGWLLLSTGAVAEASTLAEIHRLSGGIAGVLYEWTEHLLERGLLRADRGRVRLVGAAPEEAPEAVRRLLLPRAEGFAASGSQIQNWVLGAAAPDPALLARAVRRGLVRKVEEGLSWGHPLLPRILGLEAPPRRERKNRRKAPPETAEDRWRARLDEVRDRLDRGENEAAWEIVRAARSDLRREAMPVLSVPFLTLGASAAGRIGRWDEAWALLEEAEGVCASYGAAGAADSDHLGWRTAGTRAWLYARSSRLDEAEAHGKEILARAVGENLAVERSIAHSVLAEVSEKRGDFEGASLGWGRALAEARETGLRGVAPRLLYRLARARERGDDGDQAGRIFSASWEEAAGDGKDFTAGLAALGAARVEIHAGRGPEAVRWAERALVATRAAGDTKGTEISRARLAEAHRLIDAAAPSAPVAPAATPRAAPKHDLFPRAANRPGPRATASWGDVDRLREALAAATEGGPRRALLRKIDFALRDVADARWRSGDLDGCEKALRERWRLVSAGDHPAPSSRGWTRGAIARVLLERARNGSAADRKRWIDEAILHLDRAGDAKGLAVAYRLRAEATAAPDAASRDRATARSLMDRSET